MAVVIGSLVTLLVTGVTRAQDNPRYELVTEYVDQLGRLQAIQDQAAREIKEAKAAPNTSSAILSAIHFRTRMKLELAADVGNLQRYKVGPPFDGIVGGVIKVYQQQIQVHEALIETSFHFTSATPEPGVDYGKLTARVPQLRALLEYSDESLFKMTPGFCLALFDETRTDSKGNIDHRIITRSQRRSLIRHIDRLFGKRLDAKDAGYRIQSAAIMKDCLLSKRKSADELRAKVS